ncbi:MULTISPECIES: PTS transporter subunit IIC [Staphylococcus]|nr:MULTISPECIES: PTS sugar transporter subunit IIC [Staphylococcus]NHM75911.1 PTS sugar transporter subunit IIC [Staphylococcus sp. 11007852]NJH82614.1 PTS sugar transporter subunit IIC [Staphylococcus agnetis]NJH85516.1 PTS sugar transporter subunit IIC [Staphylococcus agnetis]NJI15421.1 PTS sugar transporter subunit IIC [Staphylococcus agnetis]PTH38902.1 PTS sugar transporter subunit IIC [Staphylococcus agnetis]
MKKLLHRWFIEGLSYMTLGLFSSLIIGLILETIGKQTLLPQLDLRFLIEVGNVAKGLTGAAIGAAMAYGFKCKPLVIFSALIVGMMGYTTFAGGAVGAFLATLLVVEISRIYASRTKVDIIVTPMLTLILGGAVAKFLGPILNEMMKAIGTLIIAATDQQPLLMGIIVAVIFGLCLTAPISSAALALMLDLSGLAAGAATVGCACQMVGFAIMGYKDNGISGLISIGIGTSMLQVPNIILKPLLLIPPTLASAVIAPIMTVFFPMVNNAAGAGMGTSGFVGQIMTIHTMGSSLHTWLLIGVFHFSLPIIVTWLIYHFMAKRQWIKPGDQTLRAVESRN